MNFNNKLHSEKFVWIVLWTGVRLPSSPPRQVFVELFEKLDATWFQDNKNFDEHKNLKPFQKKRSFFDQKYCRKSFSKSMLCILLFHLLGLIPKRENYKPLSPEMKQEVIKIETKMTRIQENITKTKKKDRNLNR